METCDENKMRFLALVLTILLIFIAIFSDLSSNNAYADDEYRPDYTWAEELGNYVVTTGEVHEKAIHDLSQWTSHKYGAIPDDIKAPIEDMASLTGVSAARTLLFDVWRVAQIEDDIQRLGEGSRSALDLITPPTKTLNRIIEGNFMEQYWEAVLPPEPEIFTQEDVDRSHYRGYGIWKDGSLVYESLDHDSWFEQLRLQEQDLRNDLDNALYQEQYQSAQFGIQDPIVTAIETQIVNFDDYRDVIHNMELDQQKYIQSLSSDHTTLDYIHPAQAILDTFQPSSFYDYTHLSLDTHDTIYHLESLQAPDWSQLQNMSTMDTQQFNDYLDTTHMMESQHLIDLTNLRNIEIPTGINHLEPIRIEPIEPIFIEPIRIIDY